MLHQRTSIDGLPPVRSSGFKTVGATAVGLHVLRHVMCTDVYSTPMIFLDKPAIIKAILEGYAIAEKLDVEEKVDVVHQLRMHEEFHIEPAESDSLVSVIGTLTILSDTEPTACFIVFPEQQNTLIVMGYNDTYYVIDVLHKLFYSTASPEYDVGEYQKLYGQETGFQASFYTLKQFEQEIVVEEKIVVTTPDPSTDVGQESSKKRAKTTTVEKKKK
jgi:hypothetical protein